MVDRAGLTLFATVFGTVFLAEIADKTQFATVLFASQAEHSKLLVFLGSALALTAASAVAVALGAVLAHLVEPRLMARLAGAAFILVGLWTLVRA